ncbi:MAG: hypothetical protein WKF83_15425 [Nocardioidaceae bacterium]
MAYDKKAYRVGKANGITKKTSDQWRRATAQATRSVCPPAAGAAPGAGGCDRAGRRARRAAVGLRHDRRRHRRPRRRDHVARPAPGPSTPARVSSMDVRLQ